jgi:thioredoxin-dependent peroxiredoxin
VGVSADKQATQLTFVEKFGLTFPVIPDTEKDIIDAYGAREVLGVTAKRSTFLIGPDGTIIRVWRSVKVEGHAEEVLSSIRALRAEADEG